MTTVVLQFLQESDLLEHTDGCLRTTLMHVLVQTNGVGQINC